jgi:hypothetical protein
MVGRRFVLAALLAAASLMQPVSAQADEPIDEEWSWDLNLNPAAMTGPPGYTKPNCTISIGIRFIGYRDLNTGRVYGDFSFGGKVKLAWPESIECTANMQHLRTRANLYKDSATLLEWAGPVECDGGAFGVSNPCTKVNAWDAWHCDFCQGHPYFAGGLFILTYPSVVVLPPGYGAPECDRVETNRLECTLRTDNIWL